MEVLFKYKTRYNKIKYLSLCKRDGMVFLDSNNTVNDSYLPDLKDLRILFHYEFDGEMISVYYEYGNEYLAKYNGSYVIFRKSPGLIRDYTLVNLNLI